MNREDRNWLTQALLALLLVAAAPLAVLYALGVLDDRSEKQFAAVLTLVGVIVTACAALIGHLVTRQSERRLEREHSDEQARLRLDAAMRAGTLFNASGDQKSDPAAVASGLLALTRLGRADLAVALLVDLWDSTTVRERGDLPGALARGVSHETAILVIDAALRSDSPNAQLVAAELLCRNSARLDICQSLHWPPSIDGTWRPDFGAKTKLLLVDALVLMALESKPPSEAALHSLAVRLYGVSAGDDDPHVKGCLGKLLTAILPVLKDMDVGTLMQGSYELTLEDIEAAANQARTNPDRLLAKTAEKRSEQLKTWAMRCRNVEDLNIDEAPGALAACVSTPVNSKDGHR